MDYAAKSHSVNRPSATLIWPRLQDDNVRASLLLKLFSDFEDHQILDY